MSAFLAFSVKNIFTFYELSIFLQNLPNFTYKEMLLKHGDIIITSWKLSVYRVIWCVFFCIRIEYFASLLVQFEFGKTGTRITPNTVTFYVVNTSTSFTLLHYWFFVNLQMSAEWDFVFLNTAIIILCLIYSVNIPHSNQNP